MSENKVSKGNLKQELFNTVNENVRALEALFPTVVKDGQVDFEALKEELGEFEEIGAEKYGLTWAGKQEAKKIAQEDIIGKTLKFIEKESRNIETTENLYIEGDNLEVLKLLRQNYYGAVKMIYIDPPYNTGNDFVYNDKFDMGRKESDIAEGVTNEDGTPLQKNQKSSNRYHANWLNMMYPRLKVARELLTDDGAIFISIDNNELKNLKCLCDEIFGEDKSLGIIANINNPKGRSDEKNIATAHEYILVYQKSSASFGGFEPEEKVLKRYNKCDEFNNKYRHIDLRKTGDSDRRVDRPNMFYCFMYNEITGEFYPTYDDTIPEGYIRITPLKDNGEEGRWRVSLETALERKAQLVPNYMNVKKRWTIVEKDYLTEDLKVKCTSTWTFKDVNSERGTEQFIELGFDKDVFSRPKPIGTIMRCAKLLTNRDDIILDFFSGSATTAHAVMQLNSEDGGKRKIIMVQYPEVAEEKSVAFKEGYRNICEIGKERIRRIGNKIKEEIQEANAQLKPEEKAKSVPDIGFKVFKTSDTNIRWNYQDIEIQKAYLEVAATSEILEEQMLTSPNMMNDRDQLDFMPYATDIDVVYELLLRQRDIPLSAKVDQLKEVGVRTYLFAQSYLVCLETEITIELLEKIAALQPLPIKFIFRDSAFEDDINLKDETIRRFKAFVARNKGEKQSAYTVEFI